MGFVRGVARLAECQTFHGMTAGSSAQNIELHAARLSGAGVYLKLACYFKLRLLPTATARMGHC